MFRQLICVVLLVAGARAQGAVSVTLNHDGSTATAAKLPVLGTDSNLLSVTAGKTSSGVVSKGLTLDNAAGHSLSLSQANIPDFGSQLTGAGKLNLLHNDNHRLDANAFITRNMPNIPNVHLPNFNTVGGGLDYTFKDKLGATLGIANTPFLERTDYSAVGKLNLFQSPKTSVDLSAGFGKSVSPHFSTGWQPTGGLTFTRFFRR